MAQGVRLHVWGKRALFTRPEMKVERVTYDVMTPSAARGILEAIHWKPAIRWVVTAIHVLRPIRFQTFRRNEVGSKISASTARSAMKRGDVGGLQLIADEDRQQRAATILTEVAYVIEARFDMTERAGAADNPGKHLDMFNRRARTGQCFHQPCLGTREFDAAFKLIEPDEAFPKPDERGTELGFGAPRDLGIMLWDIDHAAPDRPSIWFRARLEDGVMRIPPPSSPELMR